MNWTRTQVGYDGYGKPLYEYHLEGTTLTVCRMDPERNRGWVVYNEETTQSDADAWLLRDAKYLAERMSA